MVGHCSVPPFPRAGDANRRGGGGGDDVDPAIRRALLRLPVVPGGCRSEPLQHGTTRCNTLCNTLQRGATRCNTLYNTLYDPLQRCDSTPRRVQTHFAAVTKDFQVRVDPRTPEPPNL